MPKKTFITLATGLKVIKLLPSVLAAKKNELEVFEP
jgi:hypothetical protein